VQGWVSSFTTTAKMPIWNYRDGIKTRHLVRTYPALIPVRPLGEKTVCLKALFSLFLA